MEGAAKIKKNFSCKPGRRSALTGSFCQASGGSESSTGLQCLVLLVQEEGNKILCITE